MMKRTKMESLRLSQWGLRKEPRGITKVGIRCFSIGVVLYFVVW
jgi:hypothetical protein